MTLKFGEAQNQYFVLRMSQFTPQQNLMNNEN